MNESAVQAAIRVRASELGIRLWRNNVGACSDETGRVIRYGLGNDSAQLQKRLKSSDLVGWMRMRKHQPFFDSTYSTVEHQAVFLSVECKTPKWHGDHARFNDREKAQQAWIDLVKADGGVAFFARSVEEFESELKKAGYNA